MADGSGANNALLDYIDCLMTEGPAPASAAEPAAEQRDDLALLYIKAAGIPLAVPRADVAEVLESDAALSWNGRDGEGVAVGILEYEDEELEILDLRRLILPAGHPARVGGPGPKAQLLVLAGRGAALLCDEAEQEAVVVRGQVAWRAQRQSRPWLAGMVDNRALLDVAELLSGRATR